MTRQEIFDKVIHHLRAQRVPSVGENYLCLYRGPNGTKCAVGCLIDDAYYHPGLERQEVDKGAVRDSLRRSGVPDDEETLDLLSELQQLHDQVAHRFQQFVGPDFEHSVRSFARAYGLKLEEVWS